MSTNSFMAFKRCVWFFLWDHFYNLNKNCKKASLWLLRESVCNIRLILLLCQMPHFLAAAQRHAQEMLLFNFCFQSSSFSWLFYLCHHDIRTDSVWMSYFLTFCHNFEFLFQFSAFSHFRSFSLIFINFLSFFCFSLLFWVFSTFFHHPAARGS